LREIGYKFWFKNFFNVFIFVFKWNNLLKPWMEKSLYFRVYIFMRILVKKNF
jgi:hypothetical protein